MRVLTGVTLALLAWPASGWAQMSEAQKREACTGDVMQYCSAFIPDRQLIVQCLAARRAQISPACRTAIGGGKTPAKREQRGTLSREQR